MAVVNTSGIDEIAFSFEELATMPDSVVEEMLNAEGDIIKEAEAESARSMLNGPYYRGAVASAVRKGKVKKNGANKTLYVTFSGTQHGTRTAEIAFINEFGKHNQPARPFIQTAIDKHGSEAVDAAQKVLDDYIKSKGL